MAAFIKRPRRSIVDIAHGDPEIDRTADHQLSSTGLKRQSNPILLLLLDGCGNAAGVGGFIIKVFDRWPDHVNSFAAAAAVAKRKRILIVMPKAEE